MALVNVTVSDKPPVPANHGDIWINQTTNEVQVHNGKQFAPFTVLNPQIDGNITQVINGHTLTLTNANTTDRTLTFPDTTSALAALGLAQTFTAKQTFSADADGVHPQVNLLVNGGFEIWQRGSGPFTANAAYASDRWALSIAGTDTLSVSKDTTHNDSIGLTCAACTYVHGNGESALSQMLEDYSQLRGQQVSFSLRVNANAANACRIQIYDGVTVTYSAYHPGDGAYHTLTVTATIGASRTQVQANAIFDASCTAYIDNAMLVVGSAPINYIPLTPPEEWSRCQRYYEIKGPNSAGDVVVQGWASAASQTAYAFLPCVRKAVTPTVTKVGSWGGNNASQPTVGNTDVDGTLLSTTSSASGEFDTVNNAAGTYVSFEANP